LLAKNLGHKNSFHLLLAIITVFSFSPIKAQEITDSTNQDIELGKVSWYRDYDEAVACAEEKNKPILILFQEVPGCAPSSLLTMERVFNT